MSTILLPLGGSPQVSRQPLRTGAAASGRISGCHTPRYRRAVTPDHGRRDSCGT